MLLKWIMCRVPEPLQVPFSAAQSKWRQLSKVPGFLGQLGGWNLRAKEEACILAIWKDEPHYKQFMQQQHDKIVRHNDQLGTYESIDVSLLTPTYDMPGCRESMMASLQDACALRIADCFVKPEQEAHFVEMEQKIWIPAVCTAEGMLAGAFSKVDHESPRYMVTTLWASIEAHDEYAERTLPALRKASGLSEDVQQFDSGVVTLKNDWLVLPG
jgi:heme-degrading monooxygenase HmoA